MVSGLSGADWLVVGLYFGLILFVAWRVSPQQQSTRDYFLGGRSLPPWAAALSIVATETSAVTFIGVPRLAYEGNWWFLQLVLGFVLGRLFLARFFVRVFYRRDFETVYEYLGERFGTPVQKLASLYFLCGRVVASGVRLFAGCLALQVAAGLPTDATVVAVLALGACGILVTLAGGIRAVVWTDVVLGMTFMAGGAFCAWKLLAAIPGELSPAAAPQLWLDKMRVLDLGLDLGSSKTFLAGLAGGFVLTLATHGTDQDIVQRVLSCRDWRRAGRSLTASALLIFPLMALFLGIGTLLYFFYLSGAHGYALPRDLNHLFPVYIVRELPAGFRGFVMAGLLAASLSSLTSALNALASTSINDFYRPSRRGPHVKEEATEGARHLVAVSRGLTLLWGTLLVLAAVAFVGSSSNILVLGLQALTYFYGALLGAFLLGIFTHRGSITSVLSGMVTSVLVTLLLQLRQFIVTLPSAPNSVRQLLENLPAGIKEAVVIHVPEIAWPYWLILSTLICLSIGALGSRRA